MKTIIGLIYADFDERGTQVEFLDKFFAIPIREQASVLASVRTEIDGAHLDAMDAYADRLEVEIDALKAGKEMVQ
ncbi:MAG TPA: hypothetical protein VEF90_17770 [Xanthobacteraceae bacterium]|nr:hypothetical protein [Xanthobacteraceae bacterium]